jgi:hypothetical protein
MRRYRFGQYEQWVDAGLLGSAFLLMALLVGLSLST